MPAPTVVWRHYSGLTNSDGVCWVAVGGALGTHAISGGGFAETETVSNSGSTDIWGNDASGLVPIAGAYSNYDAGTNTTYWNVGFSAPPGTTLRTHTFAVLG